MGMQNPSVLEMRSSTRRRQDADPALSALSTMERVQQTGVLRVGYHPRNLPFSFNNEGELVGLTSTSPTGWRKRSNTGSNLSRRISSACTRSWKTDSTTSR